jgi:hypothetical protein
LADRRWRTANETARAMGKPTGAIFGVLRRMHSDGLLEADSDEPTRGTQYRLTALGERALAEVLSEQQPAGQLSSDQWLLMVERGSEAGLREFYAVLATTSLSGVIAWATSVGWGWLVVCGTDAAEFTVARLTNAFRDAGFRCHEARAGTLLSGTQLRDNATTLVEDSKASR